MSDNRLPPRLSPAKARRIDQTCDRFEAAWKAGRRPRWKSTWTHPANPCGRPCCASCCWRTGTAAARETSRTPAIISPPSPTTRP